MSSNLSKLRANMVPPEQAKSPEKNKSIIELIQREISIISTNIIFRSLNWLGPGHVGCTLRTGVLGLLGYQLGKGVKLSTDIAIHNFTKNIVIDTGTFINRGVHFDATSPIHIGKHCSIGFNTMFTTSLHDLHSDYISKRPTIPSEPIVVQDYVWLGCNVTVLGGVTIGRGSVVAAGSLVTKDIPPGCLAMGIPAQVIRRIKSEEES